MVDLTELAADLSHKQWIGWMKHLFSKGTKRNDGAIVLPPGWVKRWERQMATPYEDLCERDKEVDRAEGQKYVDLVMREMLEAADNIDLGELFDDII